ncbi:MAG: group III truncated hemoglobin [Bacteroidetes bacterium]|nr:group III truncated hemoglobin [Bacteroidota bacterium]
MKKDIETDEDVALLVTSFYEKVMKNKELSLFFEGLDGNQHRSRIEQFWRFILLGEQGYTTNVTEKHLRLPLTKTSFDLWLTLFFQTLEEHFEGPTTLLAKERARLIALNIQSKMKLLEN